jgi:nucleoside-diphosphate-sugar epimerase
MRLLVTGANGYIGERLVRLALASGHEVVAATRRAPAAPVSWLPFDLEAPASFALPFAVDAIVHLAAETRSSTLGEQQELAAARHLLQLAAAANCRFLFVSSQTAAAGAPTAYGRTKWRIEQEVAAFQGISVRPGMVYGGSEKGLFGQMSRILNRSFIYPAFIPAPKVQPIHVDDLAEFLLRCLATSEQGPQVLSAGACEPLSFTDLLGKIASCRLRRWRLPVPVPIVLIRLAGKLLPARLRARSGLERLDSLFALIPMRTSEDLARLDLRLRPLDEGLSRSGRIRRRALLVEGRALLGYVLDAKPSAALLRRYVHCIEALRTPQALVLPNFVLACPSLLALLDRSAQTSAPADAELAWRLHAAVALAEASVEGAARFLGKGVDGPSLLAAARLLQLVIAELYWRLLGLLARPMLRVRFPAGSKGP